MKSNPRANQATKLEVVTWADGIVLPGERYPVRIAHAGAITEASTYLDLGEACAVRAKVGTATLVDLGGDGRHSLIVNWADTSPDRIFDHVPRTACRIHGMVVQVCDLVRGLTIPALREFMGEIFSLPDVFRRFWTCPASRHHHHSGAAGLVQHSVEVAVLVGSIEMFTPTQRDLAVCYALLHDIGKLWSPTEGNYTSAAGQPEHERIGFEALADARAYLRIAAPDVAAKMNFLLAGRWRSEYKHPVAIIGKVVNTMDRLSASKGLSPRK